MPTITVVKNMKIVIFFNDVGRHQAAHFHILAPQGRACVALEDTVVLASDLPLRKLRPALDWAAANRDVLIEGWNRCNPHRPIADNCKEA